MRLLFICMLWLAWALPTSARSDVIPPPTTPDWPTTPAPIPEPPDDQQTKRSMLMLALIAVAVAAPSIRDLKRLSDKARQP
jgi:hypothetical protein